MKNTKLEELIRGLNKDEFRKLGDFLKSPYFNKSRQIIRLYTILKKQNKANPPLLNKRIIYRKLFGEAKYNDQKIRSLISDFVKLVDMFLLQISTGRTPIQQQLLLLREFKERNCEKNFDICLKSLQQYQASNRFPDMNDYFAYTFYNSYIIMNKSDKLKISGDEYHRKSAEAVDYYFIYSKLHFQNLTIIRNSPYFPNKKLNVWLIEPILAFIENRLTVIKKNHVPVYMEYLVFRIITDYDDDKSASELFRVIQKHYNEINSIQFPHIFYAFNSQHITAKYYSDDQKYTRNFVALIKFFERKKIFEDHHHIHETMFYNVIISCLQIGELNFAENFYNKYIPVLDSSSKSGILDLAKARLEISRKKFDNAITTLQKVENVNYQVYLNSRVFLAMAFYENNFFDEVGYLVDSVKHFLKRNREMIGLRYNKYYNFFININKIIRLGPEKDEAALLLKKRISELKNVSEKKWLLEKLSP